MEDRGLVKAEPYSPPEIFEIGDAQDMTLGGTDCTANDSINIFRDGCVC